MDKDQQQTSDGSEKPLNQVIKIDQARIKSHLGEMVRVEWVKTVPLDEAVKEKGFFGNQNSAARPNAVPVALMNGEQLVVLLADKKIGITRNSHDIFELAADEDLSAAPDTSGS